MENPLVNLTDILAENNPQVIGENGKTPVITKISAGYSHAILLDENGRIYTFGAGLIG